MENRTADNKCFPLQNELKYVYSTLKFCQQDQEVGGSSVDLLAKEYPPVDYTPPELITLLFTDLGTLTPSAVSDELIKLYL